MGSEMCIRDRNAAAAKALEQQSQGMAEQVGIFHVGDAQSAPATRQPPVAAFKRPAAEATRQPPAAPTKRVPPPTGSVRRGGPVGRMQAALATAINDDPQWKEF